MTSATYYLLFKHSPGATLRQVLQEEESVQHGQCEVSSRIRHSTYTCPNTNSSTHRWDPSYHQEIHHSDVWLRNSRWRCKQGHANFMFTQKGREIENILLTRDALHDDTSGLRVAYQRLVMCGARLSLKHCNYQALKNLAGNRKMRLPRVDEPAPAGAAYCAVAWCGCVEGYRGRCKCVKEN